MEKLFELLESMSDRIRVLESKLAKQEAKTNAANLDDGEKEFDSVGEFQKFIQERKKRLEKEQQDLAQLRSHFI